MENHHAIYGKIHYKWPFSIAMLVHQRVFDRKIYDVSGSDFYTNPLTGNYGVEFGAEIGVVFYGKD